MDTCEIELNMFEPDRFAATIPALPGLLVLSSSVDEVLERARAAYRLPRCGDRMVAVPDASASYHAIRNVRRPNRRGRRDQSR